MILVVGGIKGGSGKTTIATNLCQIRAARGDRVVLVDMDDQKSSFDWSLQRNTHLSIAKCPTKCLLGKNRIAQIRALEGEYDQIIIDVGGRDTASQRAALCIASVAIFPFRPRSVDIWTLNELTNLIKDSGNKNLKAYSILSQADHQGNDNKEALEVLKENPHIQALSFMLKTRKAFPNALGQGLGVCEYKPIDEKAQKEIVDLSSFIYK